MCGEAAYPRVVEHVFEGNRLPVGAGAAAGVLVLVAPGDRQLEIVTGKESSRRLSDRSCALAALSMTTAFSGGDLVGGIVAGLRMLAESAGRQLQPGRA